MSEHCEDHSGVIARLKGLDDKLDLHEIANEKQWTEITQQGKDIAGMKKIQWITIVLLVSILGMVFKLAFWPA